MFGHRLSLPSPEIPKPTTDYPPCLMLSPCRGSKYRVELVCLDFPPPFVLGPGGCQRSSHDLSPSPELPVAWGGSDLCPPWHIWQQSQLPALSDASWIFTKPIPESPCHSRGTCLLPSLHPLLQSLQGAKQNPCCSLLAGTASPFPSGKRIHGSDQRVLMGTRTSHGVFPDFQAWDTHATAPRYPSSPGTWGPTLPANPGSPSKSFLS